MDDVAPSGPRVVSLVPSSTETLLALGANVIACTRFCEQPDLAHVGGTKNPDIEAIVALAPDVVVLDREENRIEDRDALVAAGLTVYSSDVRSIEESLDVIVELSRWAPGDSVDRPGLPEPFAGDRRTAFVPIWRRPWMTISTNTYGGSLLSHLGVDLIDVDGVAPYPTVELDALATADPDLVLVPSEPYEFSDAHLDELREALPNAEVARVDGRDLFWWGTSTTAAIARLSEALGLPLTQ